MYARDFGDMDDLNRMICRLHALGVELTNGFKPDAYTELGVASNSHKIPATIHLQHIKDEQARLRTEGALGGHGARGSGAREKRQEAASGSPPAALAKRSRAEASSGEESPLPPDAAQLPTDRPPPVSGVPAGRCPGCNQDFSVLAPRAAEDGASCEAMRQRPPPPASSASRVAGCPELKREGSPV